MRKSGTRMLCFILLAALLLSACTQNPDAARSPGNDAAASADDNLNPPGVLPIAKTKTTLKVMVKNSGKVDNFETNEFTKWLEEKTNIHIEWQVVQNANAKEKLNITLASGEYPEVFLGFNMGDSELSLYGHDGVFIPLNPLIDKYGVETKKMFQAVPTVKDLITNNEGSIYSLPVVNECYHCWQSSKMWINKAWLDKLGLAMPTTTEEFEQVLKAFKEKDPNGNGKADEIPLVGATNSNSTLDEFLMQSFVESDKGLMFVKDGKVNLAYTQPGWKDGLNYLHKLYTEGLIAPQTLTQDRTQLKKIGDNPIAIAGAIPAQNPTIFATNWKDYVSVPPLKGPTGIQSSKYWPYSVTNGNYVITSKAKSAALAFRLADFLYSEEATYRALLGVPDKDWKVADKTTLGINGKPALYDVLTTFGATQNEHWAQIGPSVRTNEWRLGQSADLNNPLEVFLYNQTKNNYTPYAMDMKKNVPPLALSIGQTEEIASLAKTIDDYRRETFARMVIGDLQIDKEWDNYLATLDKMKIKRYLQIYQEAYDTKYKK
ncbi:extracellular solute-binding protein [Paenibacillus rigui]|uniref:ABC transporter substrate-binding protein n=1 Tax=Paenibacillus rigui TaxID=554312 RepID=A0A229UPX4_9BACL|nr:extracellular solute-binding protein [Paenibacillus rigui]OXM85410.1 ABC transporter substrate-binding protein [Paenibacillus rigui]